MGKRAGIELDDFDALFGGDTSALESKLVSASTNKADYPVMDINIELIDEFPEHTKKQSISTAQTGDLSGTVLQENKGYREKFVGLPEKK